MPQFDVDAARKAGATDDQIISYLSKQSPNFDVQGALKASSPQQVIDYLSKNATRPVDQPNSSEHVVSNPPSFWSIAGLKSKFYDLADKGSELLPAAGAAGGALIGGAAGAPTGPGAAISAVGGAGIGGMAGEAGRQLVRRGLGFDAPQTSADAANSITKQGVLQGGIQAASEVLPAAAPLLRKTALRQYTRSLAPTTVENKIIASDIAPEMMNRGLHGSPAELEQQATSQIKQLSPQVASAYASVPASATAAQSPVSKVLTSLESMKAKYLVDGEIVNPQAVNAIEGVQQIVEKHGNGISPQSLRKVKQIFDEAVSDAGGYTNADLTTNYSLKAQREAASQVREILHKASPNAAAADKEISFWLDVNQVARATNLRMAGQSGGLLKTFTPLATGLAGAAAGATHGAEAGVTAGAISALGGYVAQAMKTPAWMSASAVLKNNLADAMVRGDVKATASLLGRLGVAVPDLLKESPQPNRSATEQQ